MSSGEADSGSASGGPSSGNNNIKLEPPPIIAISINNNTHHNNNNNNNNNTNKNNNNEDNECDMDKITVASTVTTNSHHYDSKDINTILKCERCDNFETISRALLIVHIAQCIGSSGGSSSSSSSKNRRNSDATSISAIVNSVVAGGGVCGGANVGDISISIENTSSGISEQSSNTLATSTTLKTTTTTPPPITTTIATASTSGTTTPLTTTAASGTATATGGGGGGGGDKHHRKLFECDVCNMKFSNGANMRRHKMRHTGVKPYECRVCQKRFFRKDHLAEHFTTHTKTLPYHCPICNRGFQRQIAMRAHFQNEHVGQHELVKTCPLCSYRAGTMKSLRVHFFNRHGIDLDNPGPNAPSSLLMALDPQNASNYLQSSIAVAVAAAAASNAAAAASAAVAASGGGGGGGGSSGSGGGSGGNSQQPTFSDSGDSLRSAENGTPPMHFLTPHVEISMADDTFKTEPGQTSNNLGSGLDGLTSGGGGGGGGVSGLTGTGSSTSGIGNSHLHQQNHNNYIGTNGTLSPHSAADTNSNAPTSSQTLIGNVLQNARHLQLVDGHITPSISLIPIKQEPSSDDYHDNSKQLTTTTTRLNNIDQITVVTQPQSSPNPNIGNSTENAIPSSSLTSLIKVSPLKSLLREDLKRRISAKANSRSTRNSNNNNNSNSNVGNITGNSNNNNNNSNNNNNNTNNSSSLSHHNLSNSITVTAEPMTAISPSVTSGSPHPHHHQQQQQINHTSTNSLLSIATTSSNGAITSTGPETELFITSRSKRMLQCLFCGIEFPDQTLYFLHKGCHSESNPWKCNICGEQLQNVYEFNSHLLSKSHQ